MSAEPTLDLCLSIVAVRLILTGTHQGTWKDIPATGKHVRVTAMMFLRFEDGKLVEIWEDFDELGLRQQLGQDCLREPS